MLRSLAGPALGSQVELRRELLAWLGRARAAGLDTEGVVALVLVLVLLAVRLVRRRLA